MNEAFFAGSSAGREGLNLFTENSITGTACRCFFLFLYHLLWCFFFYGYPDKSPALCSSAAAGKCSVFSREAGWQATSRGCCLK